MLAQPFFVAYLAANHLLIASIRPDYQERGERLLSDDYLCEKRLI